MLVSWSVHNFGLTEILLTNHTDEPPDCSSCTTMTSTFLFSALNILKTGWIAMKFGTDSYVPHRMDCNNLGNPLTFDVVPSTG